MTQRAMIMTPAVREQIAECVRFAFEERISYAELMARPDAKIATWDTDDHRIVDPDALKGKEPNRRRMSMDERHHVEIPIGIACTFVVLEQPAPIGWSRQLSISIGDDNVVMPPALGIAVAKLFGFTDPVDEWIHYTDQGCVIFVQSLGEGGGPELPK